MFIGYRMWTVHVYVHACWLWGVVCARLLAMGCGWLDGWLDSWLDKHVEVYGLHRIFAPIMEHQIVCIPLVCII